MGNAHVQDGGAQALLRPRFSDGDQCNRSPIEAYDLPLHIAAVFILLITSFLGVILPASITKLQSSARNRVIVVLFAFQHFGSGIILSTAFVHLLFEAFTVFTNPCIASTLTYEPTSPAIAMASIYLMFCLDFFALRPLRRKAVDDDVALASSSTAKQAQQRLAKFEVITLEAGVIFHSVIIGVTLGTSSGEGWTGFLIAIAVHQFCEGIALASRIVLLQNASATVKATMYAAFSMITSIGIAIGIGIRQSYNESDPTTLLAIGTLDSISAGILLYSALVQILAGDFIHNQGMLYASTRRALSALGLIALGSTVMSILGKWA